MVLRYIEKISSILIRINEFLAGVALGSAMIIGILQVFCRYFLNSSLTWSEEIMRYMLLWLVFTTLPIAVVSKKHISLDIILEKVSPEIKKWMEIIINLIGIIIIVSLAIHSIELVALGKLQRASSINIQLNYIYIIVPISLIITAFHFIELLVKECVRKRGKIDD